MAKFVWAAFLAQLVLVFVGARKTPDYYARTPSSMMKWAYTSGIPILLLSLVLTGALVYLGMRTRSPWTWIAASISAFFTVVWLVRPIAYSILGDILLWRFP